MYTSVFNLTLDNMRGFDNLIEAAKRADSVFSDVVAKNAKVSDTVARTEQRYNTFGIYNTEGVINNVLRSADSIGTDYLQNFDQMMLLGLAADESFDSAAEIVKHTDLTAYNERAGKAKPQGETVRERLEETCRKLDKNQPVIMVNEENLEMLPDEFYRQVSMESIVPEAPAQMWNVILETVGNAGNLDLNGAVDSTENSIRNMSNVLKEASDAFYNYSFASSMAESYKNNANAAAASAAEMSIEKRDFVSYDSENLDYKADFSLVEQELSKQSSVFADPGYDYSLCFSLKNANQSVDISQDRFIDNKDKYSSIEYNRDNIYKNADEMGERFDYAYEKTLITDYYSAEDSYKNSAEDFKTYNQYIFEQRDEADALCLSENTAVAENDISNLSNTGETHDSIDISGESLSSMTGALVGSANYQVTNNNISVEFKPTVINNTETDISGMLDSWADMLVSQIEAGADGE